MRWNADYRTATDTGETDSTAIAPVNDGEPANQTILRRPPENLRGRTETVRQFITDQLVLRDFDRNTILWGGGDITFTGANPTYTGTVSITSNLYLGSAATPGNNASAPYIVSSPSSLTIGTPANNELVFTSVKKAYQGSDPILAKVNDISVEIVSGGSPSIVVNGGGGILNNIYITITGTTTCTDVINLVAGDLSASALVTATLGAGSTGTNLAPLWSVTEWAGDYTLRFLQGGVPGIVHEITDVVLGAFFGTVANQLQAGDSLAIWYDKLFDTTGALGGRFQSTTENGMIAIPTGSLFNTRREPEKIPNCIPICKCLDDDTLLFLDGSLITRGSTSRLGAGEDTRLRTPLGWSRIDTGTWTPPVSIRHALDNTDFQLDAVMDEVEAARSSTIFGAKASLDSRLEATDTHARAVFTCTDNVLTTGGMFNGSSAVKDAILAAAAAPQGATILVRTGTYVIDTALNVTYPIRLIGVDATVIITNNVAAGYMLTLGASSEDSRIENITFQKGTGTDRLIDLITSHRSRLQNLVITNGSVSLTSGNQISLQQINITNHSSAVDEALWVGNVNKCQVDQCQFFCTSPSVSGVYISSTAQIKFSQCHFDSLDDVAALETASGTKHVVLDTCWFVCKPFTVDKPVAILNLSNGALKDLVFETNGTSDIVTSFLSVSGVNYTVDGVMCNLNTSSNLFHFGADNNPLQFVTSRLATVRNVNLIGGTIPTVGNNGFSLSALEPLVRITPTDEAELVFENSAIKEQSYAGVPSGYTELTMLGGRSTISDPVGSGIQRVRNVDLSFTDGYSEGSVLSVNMLLALQPGSSVVGCHFKWGIVSHVIGHYTSSASSHPITVQRCVFDSALANKTYRVIYANSPIIVSDNTFNINGLDMTTGTPRGIYISFGIPSIFCQNRVRQYNTVDPTFQYLLIIVGDYCVTFNNYIKCGHANYLPYSQSGTGNIPPLVDFTTYNTVQSP